MSSKTLNIDYVTLPDDPLILMANEDQKWKVLEKIDIFKADHPDSTPLVAWRNATADRNQISRDELDPAKGGVFDIAMSSAGVQRFCWFLA